LDYDPNAADVHNCTNDVTQYPTGTFPNGVFVSSSTDHPEYKNEWEKRFHAVYCAQYGTNKDLCTVQMCTHERQPGKTLQHRHFCHANDAEPQCKALRSDLDNLPYRYYYSYEYNYGNYDNAYSDRECDCTDFVKDPPLRSVYAAPGYLESSIDVLAGTDWCPTRFGCKLEFDQEATDARRNEIIDEGTTNEWFACWCNPYNPPSLPAPPSLPTT
jgi:hypothetical protein